MAVVDWDGASAATHQRQKCPCPDFTKVCSINPKNLHLFNFSAWQVMFHIFSTFLLYCLYLSYEMVVKLTV